MAAPWPGPLLCYSLRPFSFSNHPQMLSEQFIPRTPPGPNAFIGTYTCSSSMPCPVGVTDYGVNKASKYSYHATTFVSWANFTKLSIGTSPIGCLGPQTHCISIQQNLVDYAVTENGKSGEYWVQDVPFVAQSGSNFVVSRARQHLELFRVSRSAQRSPPLESSGQLRTNRRTTQVLLL